jgi:NitT/TauT family transport system substrate-binding protein
MRQLWMAALAAGVALSGMFGCDRGKNDGPSATPPKEVRVGYFGNVTHAQAVLGASSGEFEKAVAPSKFSTKVFNAGPSLVEALFAEQIDIGYVGPGPALSAHAKSKGEGIRVIAGVAANGVLIVARKDSGITSLAQLKGRKVATPQLGNTQDISARHYLVKRLGQADANNVLPVANAEQAAMVSRGDVDAVWAVEPWASRLVMETGAVVLAAEHDLWPKKEFNLSLVVTTPEFLKKHPDVVEKVLRVHRSWTKRLNDEPQRYAVELDDALAKLTGKRLPSGVLPAALKNVKFTDDPMDETLATMGQWAYDLRFSEKPAKLDGLVDLAILKKLQAEKP